MKPYALVPCGHAPAPDPSRRMTLQTYRDPAFLEAFLRDRIREKRELDKLDFKLDWKIGSTKEKLELLKDINAIANTYSLDHDDHGFLIFGMNRNDGRVTGHVDLLATLGADNLEAQVSQLVQSYMHPAPHFSLYQFEEVGVGTWGALVVWPNQPPPFVFTRAGVFQQPSGQTGSLWRVGEWRLRRQALTVEPTAEDYAQMLRARIQVATAPLIEEINQLRRALTLLEGRVDVLGQQTKAEVAVDLLHAGKAVQQVQYVTPERAGQKILQPHLAEIQTLLDSLRIEHRKKEPVPDGLVLRNHRWLDRQQGFQDYMARAHFQSTDSGRYAAARAFLDRWSLSGSAQDQDFSQAWLYKYQQSGDTLLLGPDHERAEAYRRLVTIAGNVMDSVTRAATFAPFEEFTVCIRNTSAQPTGILKMELTCETPGTLHRFAPRAKDWSHPLFPNFSQSHVVALEKVEDGSDELLPGQAWTSQVFALRFSEPGPVRLTVRIWAQKLPQPEVIDIELGASPSGPA